MAPRGSRLMEVPDLSKEKDLGRDDGVIVVGLDEVGRGPIAGPIMAAAAVIGPEGVPDGIVLRDSKKMTERQREKAFTVLSETIAWGLGVVSAAEIDRIGIQEANVQAMRRALEDLCAKGVVPGAAIIDGIIDPGLPCPAVIAIPKADATSASVSAASVLAKVSRDRELARLAALYPAYGWERNAGYPTAEHLAALRSAGVTEHHRRSFGPVAALVR